jgi:hypothetical protein
VRIKAGQTLKGCRNRCRLKKTPANWGCDRGFRALGYLKREADLAQATNYGFPDSRVSI